MRHWIIVYFVLLTTASSCVKNDPFVKSYTVPDTYNVENNDVSAAARIVMMHAMYNYLISTVDDTLSQAIVDSLWTNTSAPFTYAMVGNMIFDNNALNKMTQIKLSTSTSAADQIKSFADSAVQTSESYKVQGKSGTAGFQTLTMANVPKRLFSSRGVDFSQVWLNAMFGTLSISNCSGSLTTSSPTIGQSWDLAYGYCGLPRNYDPTFDYGAEPLPKDRPLGIASLFWNVSSKIGAGEKIYQEFRRGKVALAAEDYRIGTMSVDTIKAYLAKTLGETSLMLLAKIKSTGNTGDKLYNLSKVYGLALAMAYVTDNFNDETYAEFMEIFNGNFYTMVSDPSYKALSRAEALLEKAYDF